MKNYVDIASKIQMDNNYTFKEKEKIDVIEEGTIGNISQISHTNQMNEVSQLNHNNLSVIRSNRDKNKDRDLNFTDMIPLTNPTNPNNLSVHSNFTNVHNESKISQDKNSSFSKYLHIVPKQNSTGNEGELSGNLNNMKELPGQQNGNVKNYINERNFMAGHKENRNLANPLIPVNSINQMNPINSIIPRKSEVGKGHLTKFITRNMIDDNNNIIFKGSKINKSISSQGGLRNTTENYPTGFEINSIRDRSISGKQINTFVIGNKSELSPNRIGLIRNLDPSSNNNMISNSPKFLPTFSHPPHNHQVGSQNSLINSNSKNGFMANDPNNILNFNNQNDHNSNQNSVKKIAKVFDYNKPAQIKRGMFSYSKPNSSSVKLQEENPIFDINTFASSLNYNKSGSSYYNPYSNFNDLNSISKQLAALQNNEIARVGSQSLLDNSNLSLVEKYQVKKDLSIPNLNKSDNISNIADETDKISVNSMKSTNSINFNKYKVGIGAHSTSKITTVNDNTGVSDLSTLIKYENSTNNNANYGKIVMNDNALEQATNNLKKLASTRISDSWREKYKNQILNEEATDDEGSPAIKPVRKESKDLTPNSITKPVQHFQNKPPHERESRRMQIELLKMKMRERIGKGGNKDINKVLHELKLNPLIIDKPVMIESLIENNNSLTSTPIAGKTNLHNDPRIQSILKRGITVDNHNQNKINPNQNFPNDYINSVVPNSDSANSYINTIKSTAHLNYSLEEDSNDKINMLCFLVIPRILYINISSTNKAQRIPFMFQLIPSNSCHKYGFEHYIFQWNDIKNLNPVNLKF